MVSLDSVCRMVVEMFAELRGVVEEFRVGVQYQLL